MRLRGRWARAGQVRSRAVKRRAVSNRPCVAARRGGEPRNDNDPSGTPASVLGVAANSIRSAWMGEPSSERRSRPAGERRAAASPVRRAARAAWGREAGLTWPPDPTRVADATHRGGFDFPGYPFERGMRWPRQKRLLRLKDALRAQTSRRRGRSLDEILPDVNRTLRGGCPAGPPRQAPACAGVDGGGRRRLHWRRAGGGTGKALAQPRWPNEGLARQGRRSWAAAHA